jgi:hypothetical protein
MCLCLCRGKSVCSCCVSQYAHVCSDVLVRAHVCVCVCTCVCIRARGTCVYVRGGRPRGASHSALRGGGRQLIPVLSRASEGRGAESEHHDAQCKALGGECCTAGHGLRPGVRPKEGECADGDSSTLPLVEVAGALRRERCPAACTQSAAVSSVVPISSLVFMINGAHR